MGMNCQNCEENLIAYINNETSPRLSRRIAEHLQTCGACYGAYARERDIARDAERDLTLLGRPENAQLDTIWDAIHGELDNIVQESPRRQTYGVRRGLVLIALVILCALPWSANLETWVSAAVTLRATPAVMPHGTPDSTTTSVASIVVMNDARPTEDVLPPTATSTPAVAPIPGE